MSAEYICEALGGFQITSGFVPTSPQSAAFLARASDVVLTQDKQAYDSLITGIVNAGYWSLLDALYIFAAVDVTTAKLNLVSTSFGIVSHGTNIDTSGFSAYNGYTANGTDRYLDTQYVPASAGGAMTNYNAMFGIYDLSSGSPTSFNEMGGVQDAGAFFLDLFFESTPAFATRPFTDSGDIQTASSSTTAGFFSCTASGGATPGIATPYVNGSTPGGNSVPMHSLTTFTSSITLLARNDSGTITNFNPSDQIGAAVIGAALNSTQMASLATLINNYMRVYGINKY